MRKVAFALVLAPLALAGCARVHSTGTTTPATTPPAATTASTTTPAATPVPTAHPARSSHPVQPSTTRPKSSSPGNRPPTCHTAELRIDVLRGSGISGRQFASISFTNVGTRSCAMSGAPSVELVRSGQPLDAPAHATAKAAPLVVLAPGAAAGTMLVGFSTCDAPNSDAARIAPPGQVGTVDVPLVLRGCRLEVDPVRPAT